MQQTKNIIDGGLFCHQIGSYIPVIGAIASNIAQSTLGRAIQTVWESRTGQNIDEDRQKIMRVMHLIAIKNLFKTIDIVRSVITIAITIALTAWVVIYLGVPLLIAGIVGGGLAAVSLVYIGLVANGIAKNRALIDELTSPNYGNGAGIQLIKFY